MGFLSGLFGELKCVMMQDEDYSMFNPLRKDVLMSFVDFDDDEED